jgi:aminoglycoside phosphotransferase (APT) family kinase protein
MTTGKTTGYAAYDHGTPIYVKRYDSLRALREAARNYSVFARLSPEHIPRLIKVDHAQCAMVMEYIHGGPVRSPRNLLDATILLGQLHSRWLRCPYTIWEKASFAAPRRNKVQSALWQESPDRTNPLLDMDLDELWLAAERSSCCLYKDFNTTNVIINATSLTLIDFDVLTIAPIGYDLAKLMLSFAISGYGFGPGLLETARRRYIAELPQWCRATVTPNSLLIWIEVHWLLTSPYVGKNGYTCRWPDLRPRFV